MHVLYRDLEEKTGQPVLTGGAPEGPHLPLLLDSRTGKGRKVVKHQQGLEKPSELEFNEHTNTALSTTNGSVAPRENELPTQSQFAGMGQSMNVDA